MDILKTYLPAVPKNIGKGNKVKLKGHMEGIVDFKPCDDSDAILYALLNASALTVPELMPFYRGYTVQSLKHQLKCLKDNGYIAEHLFVAIKRDARFTSETRTIQKNIAMDGCRKFYTLTRKGRNLLEKKGANVQGAYIMERNVPVRHTYATGYNFFEMLKLRLAMEWYRETVFYYNRRTEYTVSDVYRTDADCVLYPEFSETALYYHIEQDMDTEPTSTLIDKCEHYIKSGLMDHREDILVFSIWNTEANSRAVDELFSIGTLKKLYGVMLDSGADDAALLLDREDLWSNRDMLASLLDLYSTEEAALTPARLKKLIADIDGGRDITSDMVLRECRNRAHAKTAFSRLISFVNSVAGVTLEEGLKSKRPDFMALDSSNITINAFRGSELIFVATPLLATRVKYMALGSFKEQCDRIVYALQRYFSELKFGAEVTDKLFNSTSVGGIKGNPYPVCLRNAFSYKTSDNRHGALCIEFMSFDAGAWFRVMMFDKYLDNIRKAKQAERPFCLLLVFDSPVQRDKYFLMSNYMHITGGINYTGCNILYTYTEYIERGNARIEAVAMVDKTAGKVKTIALKPLST